MDYQSELGKMLDEELRYGLEIPFHALNTISKKIYTQLKLQKYMSEMDVSHSVLGVIANCIEELGKKENRKIPIKRLRDIFNDESKVILLNNRIRDYFKAIPQNYLMVFHLPNVVHTQKVDIIINSTVTIKFEPYNGGVLKSLLTQDEPKIYSLFIYVKHKGYLDPSNFDEPYSTIKQFIYLAIALNIFGVYFPGSMPRTPQINNGLFSSIGFQNNFITTESSDKKFALSFSANELDFFGKINWKITLDPASFTESIDKLKNTFITLNNTQDMHKNRIKSALEWCFESEIAQNETFQFILKFIALEALLGDDSGKGITKQLTNRCAYLLGRNHAERGELLKELPALYGIRSKLVHGTKATLDHKDKDKLSYLNAILQCALFKELNMLIKDKDNL